MTANVSERFTTKTAGGKTECFWDEEIAATVRLSIFPDIEKMTGYDIGYRKIIFDAARGRTRLIAGTFASIEDAVEQVRHICLVCFVNPAPVEEYKRERPITRIRDEHINE